MATMVTNTDPVEKAFADGYASKALPSPGADSPPGTQTGGLTVNDPGPLVTPPSPLPATKTPAVAAAPPVAAPIAASPGRSAAVPPGLAALQLKPQEQALYSHQVDHAPSDVAPTAPTFVPQGNQFFAVPTNYGGFNIPSGAAQAVAQLRGLQNFPSYPSLQDALQRHATWGRYLPQGQAQGPTMGMAVVPPPVAAAPVKAAFNAAVPPPSVINQPAAVSQAGGTTGAPAGAAGPSQQQQMQTFAQQNPQASLPQLAAQFPGAFSQAQLAQIAQMPQGPTQFGTAGGLAPL